MKLPKADKPKSQVQPEGIETEAEVVATEIEVEKALEVQVQPSQSQQVQTSLTSPRYYNNSSRNDPRATPFQSSQYSEDTNHAKFATIKDSDSSNGNHNGNGNNQLDSAGGNGSSSKSPQGSSSSSNNGNESNKAKQQHRILILYLDDLLSLDDPIVAQGLIERLKTFHSQGGNEVVVSNSRSKSSLIEVEALEPGTVTQFDAAPARPGSAPEAEGQGHNGADLRSLSEVNREMEIGVVASPSLSPSDKPGHGDEELNNGLANGTPSASNSNVQVQSQAEKGTATEQSDSHCAALTSSHIPEVAELERRLAAVDQVDIEQKRRVIKEWIQNLQNIETDEQNIDEGREEKKRRQRKQVEADEQLVREWIPYLNTLFEPLSNENISLSQASRDYSLNVEVISGWKESQCLKVVSYDKNRMLVEDKAVAVLATINKRFGGRGSRIVRFASNLYSKLNPS